VSGAVAEKPSRQVSPSEPVEVPGPPPRFASRGGEKLDAALDAFGISAASRCALDAGASTGGFTDCLLQRGARRVVAVDVGHGQLLPRLREDERVEVLERANVRLLGPEQLGGRRFDIVVADLSFISLVTVAPQLVALAGDGADMVLLVKPQFEAGRQAVSRGRGIVRGEEVWRGAIERVAAAYLSAGAALCGGCVSPLRGAGGNVEFFLHLRRDAGASGVVPDRMSLSAWAGRLALAPAAATAGPGRPGEPA
jgi:23S rRNA (cytidine1920-2'-O)/16S rRNA (cytidine1409-2'-O)-methyltransferase